MENTSFLFNWMMVKNWRNTSKIIMVWWVWMVRWIMVKYLKTKKNKISKTNLRNNLIISTKKKIEKLNKSSKV